MIKFIDNESPDIAFFAEAYREDDDMSIVEESVMAITKLGYEVTRGSTDIVNHRTDRTGFIGIVRPKLGSGTTMKAGIRQGYMANIIDPSTGENIKIGGIHLDDRSESERLKQIAELPNLDVLMGDLNAMHSTAPIAGILRQFKPITSIFQEVNTDFNITKSKLKRVISLAQRVVRMAEGKTMNKLAEQYGLYDIDTKYRPTIHGIAQIDHILTVRKIRTTNYKVHRNIKLSDHVPISATINTV